MKQSRNGVSGIPRKCLEEKAETLASQGEWVSFNYVLAQLVFGTILFLNVDWLVDLAATNAFLAYHQNKESPISAVLADAYDTFDLRCENSSARIVCCTLTLYVWLVSHVFNHGSRSVCPLQGHHMCSRKDKANWEELLASMTRASISWFLRWKEGREVVLCSCEGFPNVPLIGMRGCIKYNPMRGAPSEETITPFIAQGFNDANTKILQRIRNAWNKVGRKDKELSRRSNGVIGGYHKWLKSRMPGITWLPKLKGLDGEAAKVLEESEEVQAELEKTRVAKEKLKVVVT